jgi:hypothetical protein
MDIDAFVDAFGRPEKGTAAARDTVPEPARILVDEGLAGIYGGGALSLASKREEAAGGLGAWEPYLPDGAELFGSSGLGILFVTEPEGITLVSTQYGNVLGTPVDMEGFLETTASLEAREDLFREPLFRQWVELNGALKPTDVLSVTPALALGGEWSLDKLQPAHIKVYLDLTAGLFGPNDVHYS